MFRGVTPVVECEPGGSGYKDVVQNALNEIGFPAAEEIKFGNDVNYAEIMQEVLSGTKNKNEKLRKKA